ncbi:gamma-glutamylcyclotransferase [Streptomyces sp. NPDC008079]|uniref:gamma-glutamylcyclotransferase family protein n=1 Tax=Streptomyces sp. NPDC008079 TaxID=3364806 RepID=UPI0036EB9FB9
MTDPRLPFFLYGTLLPGGRNHGVLRGRALTWTPAELPGALLFHGPGYPYAVPDPAGEGVVHGALAAVGPEAYADVLADLDRLEEYAPGAPANLYERRRTHVRTAGGPTPAWVYFAADRTARELLLSGERVSGGRWPHSGPAAG